MKPGWVTSRLGDVATKIGSGATPLGGEEAYKQSGIYLIRSLNVHDWGFKEAKLACIDDVQAARLSNVIVQANDVLLNITGASVARCCLAPPEFLPARVNQHVSIIRTAKDKLLSGFLHYLLISSAYKIRLLNTGEEGGSTRQAITKAQIQEFSIGYPESLSEQQRIVGILDEAFDDIAIAKSNAEKNLQNARALFESHLNAVFNNGGEGWEQQLVGSVCDIKHGFAFDGADFSNNVPKGNPLVITPGNFTEHGKLLFNETNTKRFSGDAPAGSRFGIGDLVVVMTDLSSKMKILGKPAFVETDDVLHNQRIGRVIFLNGRIESRFLYYFMMSESFLKSIRESATGTMVKHTAPKRILSNSIRFPPNHKDQLAIVAKFDTLRERTQSLASIYRQKLGALEELEKALLNRAFAGLL